MVSLIYEKESYKIIGCCHEVHRELGCGFLEAVYREALAIEFRNQCIPFEQEKGLNIYFKSRKLNKKYIAYFICYDKIILELKASEKICSEHEAQLLNYLKCTNLRLGQLINFGEKSFKHKRFVL